MKRNKAVKQRNQKKRKRLERKPRVKIKMLYWLKLKRISQKITKARTRANLKFQ